MARPKLTEEERNERRERERLRSKARRQILKRKQAADVIREVRQISTIRLLEHTPNVSQTQRGNDAVTNTAEDSTGSGGDALGEHAEAQADVELECEWTNNGMAYNTLPHGSVEPFARMPSSPSRPIRIANSREVLDDDNGLARSMLADSVHQTGEVVYPPGAEAHLNAILEGGPPLTSSPSLRLQRIQRRHARRRQHTLEADGPRDRGRIVSRPVDKAPPPQTTEATSNPTKSHDRYDYEVTGEAVEHLGASAKDVRHEGMKNESSHVMIRDGSESGALPHDTRRTSYYRCSDEWYHNAKAQTGGGDNFDPSTGPGEGSVFGHVLRTTTTANTTVAPFPIAGTRDAPISRGAGLGCSSPHVSIDQSFASTPQQPSPITRLPSGITRGPSTPSTSQFASGSSILHEYIRAFTGLDTTCSPDYLESVVALYDKTLRVFFNLHCDCSNADDDSHESSPESTLREMGEHLQKHLPPLQTVFGESASYDATSFFSSWQHFLCNRPTGHVSFRKTQSMLPGLSIHVLRTWDIDSIILGLKTLAAIRAPNDFLLAFLPHFATNFSTDQIIQPHGLDIAKTRHIQLGSFSTGSVRFSAFVFFPKAAKHSKSGTSATKNALSLRRQKDFYDKIIIPAVYKAVPDPSQQEIPQSYNIVYAKSRSFQEKPGNNRWKADDESRSFRLQYTIPAHVLPQFWEEVVKKANAVEIQTTRGVKVKYFEDPRLVIQSHDLKNTFGQDTLEGTLKRFEDTVLRAFHPDQLDGASCWMDIGSRDCVSTPSLQGYSKEPCSILWKSHCHHRLHKRLSETSPEVPLNQFHFRSFLLRDVGTYLSKAKVTRDANPGHPKSCKPGLIRAKAYNCNKELFSVMFSDYKTFGSGFLPLLALSDTLIKDLEFTSQKGHRLSTARVTRASLLRAWEANKRHVRAMSESQILANYGARREITLRLDAILLMQDRGCFNPHLNPHTGRLTWDVPLVDVDSTHFPFWVMFTRDINELIFSQAARLILPLEHLFQEASLSKEVEGKAETSIQLILGFYTAQLFCRLLLYTLSSEQQLPYDNWIWSPRWTVEACSKTYGRGVFLERQGLGLEDPIRLTGMLWIPRDSLDWYGGHVNLEILTRLYIPRSPLQTCIVSQANIQSLSTSKFTVELLLQKWVQEAHQAFECGNDYDAAELANRCIRLAAEEVARSYNRHVLAKLQAIWERVRTPVGGLQPAPLIRLRQAVKEAEDERAIIVNAQTILEIYTEAWASYTTEESERNAGEIPCQLPCWMVTRKYLPPKDGWSSFVFELLFNRTDTPTWSSLEFLERYKRFKGFWSSINDCIGPFDELFRGVIGKYILVTFNSDRTKEVGTNHNYGSWYEGQPTFFQVQFWAPYFSPPESNYQFPWLWIPNHHQRQPNIPVETTSTIVTTKEFQVNYTYLEKSWLRMINKPNSRRERRTSDDSNQVYLRALDCLMVHAGPRWEYGNELPYVWPWECPDLHGEAIDHEDPFRLPTRASAHRDKPSRPTIFLPTRHNVMSFVDTVESLSDDIPEITTRIKWIREVLDNGGQQYSIASHLEAKHTAVKFARRPLSTLQIFLTQTAPPQRIIRADPGSPQNRTH